MMSDTLNAFHLIWSVLQFTDGRPFTLLVLNSYNWVSKCMGPHIRAGPRWEGIWAALLPGRECVCRVHQSLPSPGELNKLIGRLVTVFQTLRSLFMSSQSTESSTVAQLKGLVCGRLSFKHTLPQFL